jgi:hypothetical protein
VILPVDETVVVAEDGPQRGVDEIGLEVRGLLAPIRLVDAELDIPLPGSTRLSCGRGFVRALERRLISPMPMTVPTTTRPARAMEAMPMPVPSLESGRFSQRRLMRAMMRGKTPRKPTALKFVLHPEPHSGRPFVLCRENIQRKKPATTRAAMADTTMLKIRVSVFM